MGDEMTIDFKSSRSRTLLGGTAVALALAFSYVSLTPGDAAGQGQGQGPRAGQGAGAGEGQGGVRGDGRGGTSIEGRIFRGQGERVIIILEDEDSDRPDWAGGNPELNPHAKAGGGQPTGAGTMKGDVYGDLVEILRDPATGEPILVSWYDSDDDGVNDSWVYDENGFVQPLDAEGNFVPLDAEGEVYEEYADALVEVDFGRASIARSPDAVVDKALADALEKLTADGVVIGTGIDGRLTYTYPGDADGDGTVEPGETITGTIDSPLENLALYIDLASGLADPNVTTVTEALLDSLATLDTAASLLAGVADKTGDISLDYIVYQNVITGVVAPDSFYSYSTFTYDRTYPTDYSYWVSIDGADPVSMTLDINDYLLAVNGALPAADEYASLFATAADDALEVIELVHTQIHTEILPGTVEPTQ